MESSHYCLSPSTRAPYLCKGSPTGNYVSFGDPNGKLRLLGDLRKINSLITEEYTNNNHPVSTLSDAAQHLCRWRTNGHWKCLHSILPAEALPTKDLHKVLADLCLVFQVSCASTWTQSSKLTNVLKT